MTDMCQSCGHKCVARASAKCSDMFHFRWPGGREQGGYVLPHELIGLRAGNASEDYIEIEYCLVCGQIQGKWPVKGAAKYLREYAPKKFWEVYLMWQDSTWSTAFFLATTKEKVKWHVEDEGEFSKVVSFKIHDIDGQDMPDDIVVQDLEDLG